MDLPEESAEPISKVGVPFVNIFKKEQKTLEMEKRREIKSRGMPRALRAVGVAPLQSRHSPAETTACGGHMQKQFFPKGKMTHGCFHVRAVIPSKLLQPAQEPHKSTGKMRRKEQLREISTIPYNVSCLVEGTEHKLHQ